MASIQIGDGQVEEVTKPTTGKQELNSPAIDELEAPEKTTSETSPYFDEGEQGDHEAVKEDKPEDKDEEEDEDDQEKLAGSQIIDHEDDEDGVEPAFSGGGGASRGNEYSEEEDDADD